MKGIEEITYEAGRHALADQESLVAGIRQRTGTVLAAHALVASFLGATTLTTVGLDALAWVALSALTLGLIVAAIVLAPWDLTFAMDASHLYDTLRIPGVAEVDHRRLGWLAAVGIAYQTLCVKNTPSVRRMSQLSGAQSVLLVVQTLSWLVALAR